MNKQKLLVTIVDAAAVLAMTQSVGLNDAQAEAGPDPPGTMADDASVGNRTWYDVDDAKVDPEKSATLS